MSTYETAVVAARTAAARLGMADALRFVPPFFDHPRYIDALLASARPSLDEGFDHLLLSFHGLPERHIRKSDPTRSHCLVAGDCCAKPSPARATCYRAQALATAAAFVARAEIPAERFSIAFQSRFGSGAWLRPYTDDVLRELAARGVKKLLIMCPSFVADCLETLEEIAIRGRERFIAAGGRACTLIPSLNDHPRWIEALAAISAA
jgi:protoporphyrin/coproporphyrin ferrochelatase